MEEPRDVTFKLKNRRSYGTRDHDYIHIIFYLECVKKFPKKIIKRRKHIITIRIKISSRSSLRFR